METKENRLIAKEGNDEEYLITIFETNFKTNKVKCILKNRFDLKVFRKIFISKTCPFNSTLQTLSNVPRKTKCSLLRLWIVYCSFLPIQMSSGLRPSVSDLYLEWEASFVLMVQYRTVYRALTKKIKKCEVRSGWQLTVKGTCHRIFFTSSFLQISLLSVPFRNI